MAHGGPSAVVAETSGLAFADRTTALRPRSMRPSCRHHHRDPRAGRGLRAHAGRSPRARGRVLHRLRFPDREYYLPERVGGTLMCHRAHLADVDRWPTSATRTSRARQLQRHRAGGAGRRLRGARYTSQARFLLNCGIAPLLADAQRRGDWPAVAAAQKLLASMRMGELFKVIGMVRGAARSMRSALPLATAATDSDALADRLRARVRAVNGLAAWLRKIGLGRLPGDFSFRFAAARSSCRWPAACCSA